MKFIVDEKVSIWRRTWVDAESLENCIAENYNYIDDSRLLEETENEGESLNKQIFDENYNDLYSE